MTKTILYIADIAAELARTPKAVRGLIERNKIPKIKKIGGRIAITAEDFAQWLADGDQKSSTPPPKALKSPRVPSGSRPSLHSLIAAVREVADFWQQLTAALEAEALRSALRDLPPPPPPKPL